MTASPRIALTRWLPVVVLLIACGDKGAGKSPAAEPAVPGDFTVVLIPDTQYYMGEHLPLLERQIAWIAENRARENIVFAIHLGDMTNNNTPREWQTMSRVMKPLDDAGLPWSSMPGNHDGIKGGVIDSGLYNQHFGVTRFENVPGWGGAYGDTNDSHYFTFDAGGMQFLVLSLAFGTPGEQLEWGAEILARFPDRRAIFATHAYLAADGSYLDRGEEFGVSDAPKRWTDGSQIFERLIAPHANVFMTVCGHWPGQGYRKSRNAAGGVVHEILANYQGEKDAGGGYLRLLRFSPSRDKIFVEAYSPPRDAYWRDPKHSFTLDYPMSD